MGRKVTKREDGKVVITEGKDWKYFYYSPADVIGICNQMIKIFDEGQAYSLEKALRMVNVNSSTFYTTWKNRFEKDKDEEVLNALALVRQACAAAVVENGLKGVLNPAMTKFYLMNRFGWKDNSSVDVAVSAAVKEERKAISVMVKTLPKSQEEEEDYIEIINEEEE